MAFLPSYKTGTVTVTNGSATVTGSGTAWETALVSGGMFSCRGLAIPIASVDDEDEITLDYAWPGSDASGASYAIARETAEAVSNVWTADRLAQVMARLSLFSIHPEGSGTIAERNTFDDTLGMDDEGVFWLYVEPANALQIYRWGGASWEGPFAVAGDDGDDGADGQPGSAGVLLIWDTGTTDADPGNGRIRANHASLASATYLYIDDLNRGGSSIAAWANALTPGQLTITDPGTDKQAVLSLTAVTDASGYTKLAITGHSGETAFANDLPVTLQYAKAGVGDRYDVAVFIQERPRDAEVVARHIVTTDVTFPAGLTGSEAIAATAADDEAEFSLRKNGVEFGTVTFAASGTTGTFAAGSPAVFSAGDIMTIVAPSPRDADIADIAITLTGSR